VPRVRKTFEGVKRVTVPNQAMSLKEMLRRFIHREPLPVEKQGVYIESDYDLEKLVKEDRTEQEAIIEDMKKDVARKKKRVEEAEEKALAVQKAKDDAAEADMRARIEKQQDPKSSVSKQP